MDTPVTHHPAPVRMTRAAYRRWAEDQPRRHELSHAEVFQMEAERWGHARLKSCPWAVFDRDIRLAELSCQALPDGMTVDVGSDTDDEPDVAIHCGAPLEDDDIATPNPVVVVEVLSPGTRRIDLTAKLADYFRGPSSHNHLLVRASPAQVIHHRRAEGVMETRVVDGGTIRLDPPGIGFDLAELLAP